MEPWAQQFINEFRSPQLVHPSADLLLMEAIAILASVVVVLYFLRFLWLLRRHTAVTPAMFWMSLLLTFITLSRSLRIAAAWHGIGATTFLWTIPILLPLLFLIWVPVYLVNSAQQLARERGESDRFSIPIRTAAISALTACTVAEAYCVYWGLYREAVLLLVAALITTSVTALLVLSHLRRPGVKVRGQMMFVICTASGLTLIASTAALRVFWNNDFAPVLLSRSMIEAGLMFVVLGGLFVFSSLRFADVLLKDVLRTYWWATLLVLTWFGLKALDRLPHGTSVSEVAGHQLLCAGFLMLSMFALPKGQRRLERIASHWFFEQPDYRKLTEEVWNRLQESEDESSWFSEISRLLREKLGFAAVKFVDLEDSNQDSHELNRLAAKEQEEYFPTANDPLAAVTQPPAEVLLPIRVHGGARYMLAVARGPLQGSILQAELNFLRSVVRQLEARSESARLAKLRMEREQNEEQLRAQLVEAELRALRAQIQPHFLFNSLNTIAHLSIADPERAEKMTTMLASIFRYVLASTEDQVVPLGNELRFIDDYLAIEQMRFGERLRTVVQVDEGCRALAIPPLLLQPLVENALRHGLAPRIEGGTVWLTARRDAESLVITIEDDGCGLSPKRKGHSGGANVGLANVRKRLQCHYGACAELKLNERDGGGVCVSVQLPIPSEDEASHARIAD